jgi:hypothetical protein
MLREREAIVTLLDDAVGMGVKKAIPARAPRPAVTSRAVRGDSVTVRMGVDPP